MFVLDTDASDASIGAVLSQIQPPSKEFAEWPSRQKTAEERRLGREEKVISFASRSLTKQERNYCATRKELLAVVTFIRQYRHFLLGRKFLVRTDHRPLQWLFKLQDPTGQIARWQELLTRYDFELLYRPGQRHENADGMSRQPLPQADKSPLPCGT